jgi:16S rRNA (cytidine1402-2'-O)-methyltransferase
VFFESPRRLAETLADCAAILGKRNAAIARELTKMFESVRRGPLDELAAALAEEEPPKGEIVLLVAPPGADAAQASAADLDAKIEAALTAHSVKDAASVVSAATGQPRRQVYARALELAAGRGK